jgi:hypothetical protein
MGVWRLFLPHLRGLIGVRPQEMGLGGVEGKTDSGGVASSAGIEEEEEAGDDSTIVVLYHRENGGEVKLLQNETDTGEVALEVIEAAGVAEGEEGGSPIECISIL